MADVTYISRVRIDRLGGPHRLAFLPGEDRPVVFGVHPEVAAHYGVRPEQYARTQPRSTMWSPRADS